MAQASWPNAAHNSRAVTDREYELLCALETGDGVYGDPTESAVVAAGVGLAVDVRAGVFAHVRGHVWTSGGTALTLPIGANASGMTRIDRVVLRMSRTTWQVTAEVIAGTPGAPAPALTRDPGSTGVWEVPLALVTVLNGSGSVVVVREEQYVGGRVRPCRSSARPLNPGRGDIAFEVDTGRWIGWNGSAWVVLYEYSGVVVATSSVSGWSAEAETTVERAGGSVHLRLGTCERTGGATSAETRLPVNIPTEYLHPSRDQFGTVYLSGTQVARVTVYRRSHESRAGQVWVTQHSGISTGQNIHGTSISWAVGA
ncbi:hypothetical protein [Streptomyces sp. URMC 129]|uniref:hypothetical protein n=1 Tax=Streptomyces sp. URMC 129 TaxID=3423407 RepID=UPI003F1AED3C